MSYRAAFSGTVTSLLIFGFGAAALMPGSASGQKVVQGDMDLVKDTWPEERAVPTGVMRFKVLDRKTKEPVPDADVRVTFRGKTDTLASLKTDVGGRAYFDKPVVGGGSQEFDVHFSGPEHKLPEGPLAVSLTFELPGIGWRVYMMPKRTDSGSHKFKLVGVERVTGIDQSLLPIYNHLVVPIEFGGTVADYTDEDAAEKLASERSIYEKRGYRLADSHTKLAPPRAACSPYDIGENRPTKRVICGGTTLGYLFGRPFRAPTPLAQKIIETLGKPVPVASEGDVVMWSDVGQATHFAWIKEARTHTQKYTIITKDENGPVWCGNLADFPDEDKLGRKLGTTTFHRLEWDTIDVIEEGDVLPVPPKPNAATVDRIPPRGEFDPRPWAETAFVETCNEIAAKLKTPPYKLKYGGGGFDCEMKFPAIGEIELSLEGPRHSADLPEKLPDKFAVFFLFHYGLQASGRGGDCAALVSKGVLTEVEIGYDRGWRVAGRDFSSTQWAYGWYCGRYMVRVMVGSHLILRKETEAEGTRWLTETANAACGIFSARLLANGVDKPWRPGRKPATAPSPPPSVPPASPVPAAAGTIAPPPAATAVPANATSASTAGPVRVTAAGGGVYAEPEGGDAIEVGPGTALPSGRPVTLSNGSSQMLTVDFGLGGKLNLTPGSRVRIPASGVTLSLLEGAATVDTAGTNPGPKLEIATPGATVIHQDTVYSVTYDPRTGVTEISVREGSVKVVKANSTEAPLALRAGETRRITSPPPENPTGTNPASGLANVALLGSLVRVVFDGLQAGYINGNEFRAQGLRMTAIQGRLNVMAAPAPPMVMPAGQTQVLMVGGDRVTEFALEFNPPVKSFTITLPGLGGGASFPTYSITVFNPAGAGFDMIGQQHWIPSVAAPARITLDKGMMSRAVIAVDNRFGDTAWATYNCLPIAGIELQR